MSDLPEVEETHVVWIRKKEESAKKGQDTLFKPFTAHQVLEKCQPFLESFLEKVHLPPI